MDKGEQIMKAIELAKVLYPALSNQDIIEQTCPDTLLIVDKISCSKTKQFVDDSCIQCWNRDVSEKKADWLIQAKKMCDLMCD